MVYNKIKFILFTILLYTFHIWEKFGFWDINQNVVGQPECKIFKLTTSLEQNDEIAFFACCSKSWKFKAGSKIFGWVYSKVT